MLARDEERKVGAVLNNPGSHNVWIYGRNCTDKTPYRKAEQLLRLGLPTVAVYPGGMLEWTLLGDACGTEAFPVTGEPRDVLDFLD